MTQKETLLRDDTQWIHTTNSRITRQKITFHGSANPKEILPTVHSRYTHRSSALPEGHLGGLPSLSLTTKGSWIHLWGRQASRQLSDASNPSVLCGDANPHQLEKQSCSEWQHTLAQALSEVSEKCHFTFSFDSTLCMWRGEFFTGNYILWYPLHSGIMFWSADNNNKPKPITDPWSFDPQNQ